MYGNVPRCSRHCHQDVDADRQEVRYHNHSADYDVAAAVPNVICNHGDSFLLSLPVEARHALIRFDRGNNNVHDPGR